MSKFFSMIRLTVWAVCVVGAASMVSAQDTPATETPAAEAQPAPETPAAEAPADKPVESPAATTPATETPAGSEKPAEPATEAGAKPAEEMLETTHDDHADGGHAHDPTDLGHGNGTATIGSPIDFRFDLAIWTFVVFLLLLIVLGKFAWGPISEGLEKRERGIEEKIEEAHRSAEKAAEQLRMYEAKLAAAAEEARQIAVQAKADAEAAKDQILAEAKALATRERERAIADIAAAKNVALREIAEKSVNTAVSLAKNIVQREIKPGDHAQLIREAMEKFPSAN